MKRLRKGQKVRVYNHDSQGNKIIEGTATVVRRKTELGEGWYKVMFSRSGAWGVEYVDRNLTNADIL